MYSPRFSGGGLSRKRRRTEYKDNSALVTMKCLR